MNLTPYTISGKSGSAKKFFKKRDEATKEIIRGCITKIRINPHRDGRKRAMRHLEGGWKGYIEFKLQEPLLRIIYFIDDRAREIYIEEILPHL